MDQGIRKPVGAHALEPVSLGELIHQHVRVAIEAAVHEELLAALGVTPYERSETRRGYRNGIRERTLTGPTGPIRLSSRQGLGGLGSRSRPGKVACTSVPSAYRLGVETSAFNHAGATSPLHL